MELVCIACPNGCSLTITNNENGGITVTGHKCPKGVDFANEEILSPKRSVSTTVRTSFKQLPVVPVRTSGEIPKDRIFEFIEKVSEICLDRAYDFGEPVISDLFGTGIDVICTVDMKRLLN